MIETNRRLAQLFQTIAQLLTARGENPYRVRAYRRAADAILALDRDVTLVAEEGALSTIAGIGKELEAKIQEFLRTGTVQAYEQLRRPLPPEIAEWASLPGLTEAVVEDLYHRLRIRTWDDLESLVRSHLLRTLPGVSVAEEALLAAIEERRRRTITAPAAPSDLKPAGGP